MNGGGTSTAGLTARPTSFNAPSTSIPSTCRDPPGMSTCGSFTDGFYTKGTQTQTHINRASPLAHAQTILYM